MRSSNPFLAKTLTLGLTVCGLTVGLVWPANAQAPSTPAQPPTQPSVQSPMRPAASIPDKKLDAAAVAINHVTAIKKDYQQKIEQAPPTEKDRLSGEGNAALAKAVTDQGLTVDEYNSIIQTARNDPAVKQRLLQRLKPPADGSGSSPAQ